MAWQPQYVSTDDLKDYLRIGDSADDADVLTAALAASRAIDQFCGRQFGVLSSAAARYYTPRRDPDRLCWVVDIDDLQTTTALVVETDTAGDGTFATTLTLDTDFRLAPYNAAADGLPWTMLVPTFFPSQIVPAVFPGWERSVRVTAKWGWTAVPDVVKQAALIQAARFFARRNAPFGVAGSPDMGSEMRLLARVDPDVAVVLGSVKRFWGAV